MTVIELYEKTWDNLEIVITREGKQIAHYDGRNSIPAILNEADVDYIDIKDNKLIIEV